MSKATCLQNPVQNQEAIITMKSPPVPRQTLSWSPASTGAVHMLWKYGFDGFQGNTHHWDKIILDTNFNLHFLSAEFWFTQKHYFTVMYLPRWLRAQHPHTPSENQNWERSCFFHAWLQEALPTGKYSEKAILIQQILISHNGYFYNSNKINEDRWLT